MRFTSHEVKLRTRPNRRDRPRLMVSGACASGTRVAVVAGGRFGSHQPFSRGVNKPFFLSPNFDAQG